MDHSKHIPLTPVELNPETLEGANVYGVDDHKIGKVDHVHVGGTVDQVIIDVGGVLGIGAKPSSSKTIGFLSALLACDPYKPVLLLTMRPTSKIQSFTNRLWLPFSALKIFDYTAWTSQRTFVSPCRKLSILPHLSAALVYLTTQADGTYEPRQSLTGVRQQLHR